MLVLLKPVIDQEAEVSPVQEEPQQQASEVADIGEAKPAAKTSTSPEQSGEGDDQDIAKMTVKQLQALAKQRGIGITRTKTGFLRVIKEKHPDEDLERLQGKGLFDWVSKLHISRLGTKAPGIPVAFTFGIVSPCFFLQRGVKFIKIQSYPSGSYKRNYFLRKEERAILTRNRFKMLLLA